MNRLQDRVALITGAGAGIGKGVARRFAAEGASLWLADINADAVRAAAGSLGDQAVAVHLLRMHPERYRAVINLSGFLAPAGVPGTAPADDRLTDFEIPVYFGYGKNDAVIPKYELFAAAAWLEEHTLLTTKNCLPPACASAIAPPSVSRLPNSLLRTRRL